jgi:hypothetical protein
MMQGDIKFFFVPLHPVIYSKLMKTKLFVILLMMVVCGQMQAQPKSRVIEDGGSGPYKAIMTEVEGLAEHTVFMPQDLSQFDANHPLPILVWGNGACANSPFEHANFLNEIASYGGTYRQPHGGEFSVVALAWLQWQLKGDQQAAKMFVGKNNLLSKREGWTLEKNKKMK